jgi:feruloyl esterase
MRCLLALIVLLAVASHAAVAAPPAAERCILLNAIIIPSADIGLPTSGARITSAEFVPSTGNDAALITEHCKVMAAILPRDPAAPEIRFVLALPTDWNGKTLMLGGGAFDGSIPNVVGQQTVGPADRPPPVSQGYAVFGSDSGHQGSTANAPTIGLDGTFAMNDEALANYAGDALKKTRDAAMQLIVRRYERTPTRNYFAGGSNGGREAFAVITRWPQDFDGAIAAYPYWNAVVHAMTYGRIGRALAAPGAYPNNAKLSLLFDAVMQACDGLDDVKDGVISNVAACRFDINSLRCAGGGDTGDTCLSDAQIAAIRSIDAPVTYKFPLGGSETTYPGWPVLAGGDLRGPGNLNSTPPAFPVTSTQPRAPIYWEQLLKYGIARDPALNYLDFDPEDPGVLQRRLALVEGLIDVTTSDLSSFQAHGGKLLIVQGLADVTVSPRSTIMWWDRLIGRMGASTVHQFARFYTVPGYGHGPGGGGVFNAAWDSLPVLDAWADSGKVPGPQTVTDTNTVTRGRTRPLCEYPSWPKFTGEGDRNMASSFVCSE